MTRRRNPCDTGRLGPQHVEGEIVTPCPTCYGFREDHPDGCPSASLPAAQRRRAPRPGEPSYMDAIGLAMRALRALPPEARDAAVNAIPQRYRKVARAALALLAHAGR